MKSATFIGQRNNKSRKHVFLCAVLYYRRIINIVEQCITNVAFYRIFATNSRAEQLLYAKLASKSNIHHRTGLIHCDKWICFSIKYSHRRQCGVASGWASQNVLIVRWVSRRFWKTSNGRLFIPSTSISIHTF